MDRFQDEHAWDLVQQAHPETSNPFGFICCCGAGAMASFSSVREAIRAARSHSSESVGDARAA